MVEVATGAMYAVDDVTCMPEGWRGCSTAEEAIYSKALSLGPCV
jgi:hypothetical protein